MPVISLNSTQPCDSCYVFRIQVANYASGSLVIEIGNVISGVFTSIGTIATLTANGSYNIDIDPTDYDCETGFSAINITPTGWGMGIYFVQGLFVAASCAPQLCSRCFNVTEYEECLLELSWTNGRDFADLDYSTLNYTQRVWVKGELANASYPTENNVFRFGNGDTILTYGRRVKTMQLMLRELPEFMHNAISLGLIHDQFYVNGEQFRLNGEGYDPIWRRTSKLAPVIVELIAKQENSRNQLC